MGSGEEHWRRVELLESLASDRAAVPTLIAVLEEDEKECWHTKTAAIRSLVTLGDGGAAILKTLARDADPDVRQAAIDGLGALRFVQATRMLQRICDDPEDALRERARAALAKISGGEAL
jgi:HEAT repeat protein